MQTSYGYQPFIATLLEPGGNLVAGIPLMEVKSFLTGKRWVSLPFTDYCRPLATTDSAIEELRNGLVNIAQQEQIPELELRWPYPILPSLRKTTHYVLHEVDLQPGDEYVWRNIHEMHRRNIKIARESNLRIIEGITQQHLADFYHLHTLTRRRQGVPVQPWKFFLSLKHLLLERRLGFLLLAYKDEQCVAGAVFLHWQGTLTYKYGASREDSLKYRPNNLIMWTAMQRGCAQGFSRLDMGRTDLENTGLRAFKSRWGAIETPLVYTHWTPGNINSLGSGRIKSLMNALLQHSPAWVCRFSGEILYKHFG